MEKRKKFNIIDVVILAIVILAAGFFVWRYAIRPAEETAGKERNLYHVTITMDNIEVSEDSFENGKIEVGDTVIDKTSGVMLGVVKDIETKEPRSFATTAEGQIVLTARPLHKHLILTVEGQAGLASQGGLRFGELQLLNNKSAEIIIKDTAVWLRFVNFTVGEPVEN